MKRIFILFVLFSYSMNSYSQGSMDYGPGMKINFDGEGSKYMRFITWNQIWIRSSEMNPGTMIANEPATTTTDIGNRRLRMLMYAQLSKRYMIVTHFGINNQTFTAPNIASTVVSTKKPGLFFHDAWNEYTLVAPETDKKFSMSLGAGLHYYMGLSRMTMISTLNLLTIDGPVFNWPLIENSDQFARHMGIFAKGKYDKLEYRLSFNKPFSTNSIPVDVTQAANAIAVDNNGNPKWAQAGYFEYQFFDQESNLLPYKVGTYLGTKRVFNLGAGFYTAPQATKSSVNGIISKHDIKLFSVDAFLDLPVGNKDKKMAFTAYSVFYHYDFGPNYLRNIGIMNIGSVNPDFSGERALAGAGNTQPTIGTGKIWYMQAGFLLPNTKEKPEIRIQPFGAYTFKNFEALEKASSQFDIGANFLLDGHHAKITTEYSTRPIYTSKNNISGLKSEFIIQLQIYL